MPKTPTHPPSSDDTTCNSVLTMPRSLLPTMAPGCGLEVPQSQCPCPQDALEITGTFKQCKSNLVKEGFDPNVIQDRLFFRDNARKSYVPLTPDTFAAIRDMKLSL